MDEKLKAPFPGLLTSRCHCFCCVGHLCGSRTIGDNHLGKSVVSIELVLYRPPCPCGILTQKNKKGGATHSSPREPENTKPRPLSSRKAAFLTFVHHSFK